MAKIDHYYLPDELYYEPEDHLWIKMEEGVGRVGIDQLGQETAGTIVHISIPPVGRLLKKKEPFGFLEAGKFVGPLRMPINGSVLEVNQGVLDKPEVIHRDPYGAGWLILVQPQKLTVALDDLIHGEEAVARWLKLKVQAYRERGVLPDEDV